MARLLGTVFVSVLASVPEADGSLRAQNDAYDALIDRYQGISAVYVEAVSGPTSVEGTAASFTGEWYAAYLVAADRSGRLGVRTFGGPTAPDLDGRPTAMQYLADGALVTHTHKSLYRETQFDGTLIGPPPSPHYLRAPWPVLPIWVDALRGHEATELAREGDRWIASNVELGLRMEWELDGSLRSARWNAPPPYDERAWTSWSYADLDERGLPREAVQVQRVPSADGAHESRFEMDVTVSTDPARIEEAIVFDPEPLRINRLDVETMDVYSPDGELLYNLKERERMLLRAEERRTGVGLARRLAIGVIVVAAGLSVIIGWRRWASRG